MDNVDSVQPAVEDDEKTSEPTRADAGDRPKPDKGEQKSKDGDDPPKKKGSKLPLIILGIVILLAAIGAVVWWYLHRNQTDTDDAYTDGRVVMMASQVNGYVTVLAVNDNQFVHKGDLLVQIDPRPYEAARDQAKGELASAQAQLDSARIALDKAKTTFPAQLAQAQGQLAQAQGTFAKLIPQNVDQAAAQVSQLEGDVLQMRAKLATAEVNLGFTRVTAPQDGWVTRRNVEQGNYLQPGQQIMALVTPEVWVTANFKETQLARMRRGQEVDMEVDAYPNLKLKGHIDSVQLGSGSKFSAFPAENATGNFVKIVQRIPVKIIIDSGLDKNEPLPLGASVTPTVFFR